MAYWLCLVLGATGWEQAAHAHVRAFCPAWHVVVWRGMAWRGVAWHGGAWRGMAGRGVRGVNQSFGAGGAHVARHGVRGARACVPVRAHTCERASEHWSSMQGSCEP